jgi:D-threo-aldose 1-dehydrogenase
MDIRPTRRGIALTRVGFGSAPIANLFREVQDEVAAEAVAAAWDAGIRYFDTAPHYGVGLAERRLGAALAAYPRDEYVVSTKVGRLLVPSPETAGQQDDQSFVVPADPRRQWDFSRDGVLRSLEQSLDRLGMSRVDIVLLHDPDEHWEQASTTGVDTLVELRDQGVIGAIGVGMNQAEMLTEFIRRTDVDLVLEAGRYTLLDQRAADELLPTALERGVDVIAAGVYNSGLLSTRRPAPGATYQYAPPPVSLVARANRIADVCEAYGVTLPEVAVAFPLRHPAVVSALLGLRTATEVAEAAARASADVPEAVWAELEAEGLLASAR